MLFRVTDKNIFEDNPELMAFNEFSDCSDRQLKYVFLCFDYDGPFRRLPIDQKKEQAAIRAGYKREPSGRLDKNARNAMAGNVKNIERAFKAFMKLQYDEDKDLHESYRTELEGIKEFLRKKNKNLAERKMSLTYLKELPELAEKFKSLQEILDIRKDEINKDDEVVQVNLSTLDKVNMEQDGE